MTSARTYSVTESWDGEWLVLADDGILCRCLFEEDAREIAEHMKLDDLGAASSGRAG